MKKLNLTLCIILLLVAKVNSQEKNFIMNHPLLEDVLLEYTIEAEKRNINITHHLDEINWILIEIGIEDDKYELDELKLGKVDKESELILISRVCLIDRNILKATLFRELHHYFGVPYEEKGSGIMSLQKPVGYSFGWIDYKDITDIEFDAFFDLLKKHIN